MKLAPQESLDTIATPACTRPSPKESDFLRRAFVTSDGVQLSYIRQGSGRPVVLLHGWSQCAEEFNTSGVKAVVLDKDGEDRPQRGSS